MLTADLLSKGCTNNSPNPPSLTLGNSGAFNLGVNTFSTSPVLTAPPTITVTTANNRVLGLMNGSDPTSSKFAESMQNYLSSPLVNGQVYQISFWIYNYSGIFKFPRTLVNTATFTVNPNSKRDIFTFSTSSLTALPVPSGEFWVPNGGSLSPIFSYTTNSINTWEYVSNTFTYTGSSNGNLLIMGSDVDANRTAGYMSSSSDSQHYIVVDNISIVPVSVAPILSIPQTTYCLSSPTVSNVAQYASPSNTAAVVTGPGITNVSGVYNFNPALAGAGTHLISYSYTDGLGCPHMTYQYLTVHSLTVSPALTYVYAGNSATLTAGGTVGSYSWNPGAVTGTSVIVTPTATTVYTVTNGFCPTTATVIPSTACSQSATASYSNTNFPSGTYTATGQVLNLTGTITFTGNTSFTGYTLRMSPGALLKIDRPATLTLNNCKLYGCTELWAGIQVDGTDAGANSSLDVKNGTTIEDMYYGIFKIGTYTTTTTGNSFIKITDSKLNKNYVGVQLISIPGTSVTGAAYPLTVKNSTITSGQSITSPGFTLKPSSIPSFTYAYNKITGGAGGGTTAYTSFPRGYIGINLYNLSTNNLVVIGDSAADAVYNTFSNLDFGISSTNAHLRVHNNYFTNMAGSAKRTYFDPNNPVTVIGPDEIGIGIVTQHTVANTYSLQVGTKNSLSSSTGSAYPKANEFRGIYKGISAKNCITVIAKGNLFDAASTDDPYDGSQIYATSNSYLFYQAQSAIWISGLSKNAGLNYNYIKNYNAGIYSAFTMSATSGAYININNNNIDAQQTTGYCRQAINVEQVGGANIGSALLEVASNSITSVYGGIYSKSVMDGLNIHDNANIIIDNVKTLGKGVIPATYSHYGISILSTQKAIIKKNTNIHSITTSSFTASSYSLTNGVSVVTSPNNTITCNTTNNVGRGFYFQGNCISPNGWLANGISNSYTGLELKTSGVIGIQGAVTSLAANTWSNVTRETYVSGTSNANTSSIMYVQANGTYTTAPGLNYALSPSPAYSVASGQGIDIRTGTPYNCATGGFNRMASFATNVADNDNVYYTLATTSATTYPAYSDEMMFSNQQMVYALQDEGLVTKTAAHQGLQSFYNGNTNSNIGKFTNVLEAMANGQLTTAQSKNNAIAAGNTIQKKTKRVNELVLKLNLNPNYRFSNAEWADLKNYAAECEVKGRYVAQSRNIINSVQGYITVYDNVCDDAKALNRTDNSSDQDIDNTESNRSFNVFPNPNKGSMTLMYNLGKDTQGTMNLYDVTGKLINTYDLQGTVGTIEINEPSLGNGIYFYRILVKGIVINTNKVVIIK